MSRLFFSSSSGFSKNNPYRSYFSYSSELFLNFNLILYVVKAENKLKMKKIKKDLYVDKLKNEAPFQLDDFSYRLAPDVRQ